jgi:tetratricopeptide (TPR) repeat protein
MSGDDRKNKIKKILEETGRVLGGGAGEGRVVVLRFPNIDELKNSLRLFPKAFPRISWQSVPVTSGHLFNLLRAATAASDSPQHKVSILYDFPGELDDRVMSADAAMDLERAVTGGALLKTALVLAVLSPSIRVLAEKAPGLWAGKGGYFAWPSKVVLPEPEENRASARPSPLDDPELSDRPSEDETRQVLKDLTGKEAADYLVMVARSHLSGGDNEHARLFLLRAVQIYSETADLEGMAASYHLLGAGAEQRGDYSTALEWFSQAIDSFTIADDQVHLSESLAQKGYVHYLNGQYEAAVRNFNEALAIDQKLGNKERESAGMRKIAMVLEILKKFPAAQDLYQKSLAVEQELGNEAGQARVYHHLGRLQELQMQYDEAIGFYQQSLDLKLQINDRQGLATTYHQLGNLKLMQKSYDEALESYQSALEAEKKLGDRQGLARTHAQVGLAYRELGKVEKALYHLILAYQVFQRLRSPLAGEVLAKVEELQDLVPADTFNRILREATATTSSL